MMRRRFLSTTSYVLWLTIGVGVSILTGCGSLPKVEEKPVLAPVKEVPFVIVPPRREVTVSESRFVESQAVTFQATGIQLIFGYSPTGCSYHIETSTNLKTWTLADIIPGGGIGVGKWTNSSTLPFRFYRIMKYP